MPRAASRGLQGPRVLPTQRAMVPRAPRRALVAAALCLAALPSTAAPAGAAASTTRASYGGATSGGGGDWWWYGDDGSDPTVDTVPATDDGTGADPSAPATPAGPATPSLPAAPVDPVTPMLPEIVVPTSKTIPGKVALVRADGKAAIPRGAPARVRSVIAAANTIIGKPYKWGGGHARLVDKGYDCSGSVSYALIRARLLGFSMVSGQLATWAAGGPGRWISIYANRNHVYMEVAGLRLDTSAVGDPTGRMGVRWRPVIGKRPGFHTRHIPGL